MKTLKKMCCWLTDTPDTIKNAIYQGPAWNYSEFNNPEFKELAGKKKILPETAIVVWEKDNAIIIMKQLEIIW